MPVDVVTSIDVLMPGSPDETIQDGISPVGELTDYGLASVWPVDHARLRGIAVQRDTDAMLGLRLLAGHEKVRAWQQFGWGDH